MMTLDAQQTGDVTPYMNTLEWTFSDKILDQVVGTDDRDVKRKQDMLRKNFIGKGLKKFYSPKRQACVYRIGHTNRIISESEFQAYVNSGLLVPSYKQKGTLQRSTHIAKQIVGNTQNTADIPVAEPSLYYEAQTPAVTPAPALTKPVAKERRTPLARKAPQQATNVIASQVAVPVPQPVNASTNTNVSESYMMASYALQQTGMMQAIDDSDFFDMEVPTFKPFEEDKPKKDNPFVNRIKGFFHKKR